MLDKLSEANREQIQSYISTIWDNIAEGIAESRGISVNDINPVSYTHLDRVLAADAQAEGVIFSVTGVREV